MIINPVIVGSGGSAPAHYIEKTVDANGVLQNGTTFIDLTGVTEIGNYALYSAYRNNQSITGIIDCSNITKINASGMATCFQGSAVTGVDFRNLLSIGQEGLQNTFYGVNSVASIDFRSLKIIGQSGMSQTFVSCSVPSAIFSSLIFVGGAGMQNCFTTNRTLQTLDCSSLTTGGGQYCFSSICDGCSALTTVKLDSFKKNLSSRTFTNAFKGTALTTLSFPALATPGNTNVFDNMLSGVTGCTVHFPSNMQSVIGSWASVTGGFSGTNTTVLFDLPSTAHLIGVNTTEYERNPKYDTATALAWRVKDTGTDYDPIIDWTAFYTSGTTDPAVGTTIYSDSACTVAVTTIDSIA